MAGAEEKKDALALLAGRLVRRLGRHALSPMWLDESPSEAAFSAASTSSIGTVSGKLGWELHHCRQSPHREDLAAEGDQTEAAARQHKLHTADVYGNTCHSTYDVVKEILTHLRRTLPGNCPISAT